MDRVDILETDLDFDNLVERDETDMIVIHHTGGSDIDASAEQIHEWHLNNGWAGIGYHYVIRKDGTIERGRPEWAVGSHAYGENSHTIGIHLSGDFDAAQPTGAQIDSLALLIADICDEYDIPADRDHIVGHGELMATDCPGGHLQALLDDGTIISKINDELYGGEDNAKSEGAEQPADIEEIAVLARKYESNGDPACVSDGDGDLGGRSYGLYQFASALGVVDEFVAWLCEYHDPAYANYGRVLAEHEVNSPGFVQQWQELGTIDPQGFGALQDEYIKEMYYNRVEKLLRNDYYRANKHTTAMRAVLLSRAIQNGPTGCYELMKHAVEIVSKRQGWNLSYVDDQYFDRPMIAAVYDFLVSECDYAAPDDDGIWRSREGYCNGSKSVIFGLRSRFIREKEDALAMLGGGGR